MSIGILDENNLENPILMWDDTEDAHLGLDSIGLTGYGSGVLVKYRCVEYI